jgi:hypothetical protein
LIVSTARASSLTSTVWSSLRTYSTTSLPKSMPSQDAVVRDSRYPTSCSRFHPLKSLIIGALLVHWLRYPSFGPGPQPLTDASAYSPAA